MRVFEMSIFKLNQNARLVSVFLTPMLASLKVYSCRRGKDGFQTKLKF